MAKSFLVKRFRLFQKHAQDRICSLFYRSSPAKPIAPVYCQERSAFFCSQRRVNHCRAAVEGMNQVKMALSHPMAALQDFIEIIAVTPAGWHDSWRFDQG